MTINSLTQNATDILKEITNKDFPTVLFDATGNKKAINNTFQYMAHGARYVLVGLQKDEICFSHPEFHKREGTLMSSRNATREDFEYVIKCLEKNWINASDFITHKIPFDEVKEKFNGLLQPENNTIKAIVNMN
jgi:threonine dehydrogenase-like Zn-dependent dehydrogenase